MSNPNDAIKTTANKSILLINSSGRYEGSVTRMAADKLVSQLQLANNSLVINKRDLATGLPFVDEQWIAANFTDPEKRQSSQKETLEFSDELVSELQQADTIVIASPIYNFNIPAVLKAWIDLIARARLTFQYTENGPEGLLLGKTAYLVMASGGVPIGSEMDLASKYLVQVLGFVGISDVRILDATKIDVDTEELDLITA